VTSGFFRNSAWLLAMVIACAVSLSAQGRADPGADTPVRADNWQLRRLTQPTPEELTREANGEVVIYDGLTDQEVDAAMTAHPGRIRSMMFVGTIVTDASGKPEVSSDAFITYVQEDEGC
jgi:hypothetical protein